MVDLDAAESESAQTLTQAEAAERDLDLARGDLARVALSADDASSGLAVFQPFLRADALDEALARAELLSIAGTTSARATERFSLAEQAARAASVRASQAADVRQTRAEEAERAAAKAERAAMDAARQEADAETQHAALLTALADKRGTTAELEAEAEQARIAEENERARQEAEERQARVPDPEPPAGETAEEAPASDGSETSAPPPSTPQADPPPSPTAPAETAPAETPPPSDPQAADPPPAAGQGEADPPPTEPVTPTEPADPEPPAPEPPATSSAATGEAVVAWARAQLGKPYRWGASGPDGFDCSGLTSAAWAQGGGKAIPRVASSQYAAATKVPFDSMRPGDLIFWGSSAGSISHVAIYSGGGMMIEAPRAGQALTEIPVRWSGVFGYAGRF
jgi:cell wall-associated NlpC family hydrolase